MYSLPSFSKLARGPIATITIKPSGTVYRIYKDLICHHSAYFERAFVVQGVNEMTIDKSVSTDTMNLFVDWLYSGKVDVDEFPLVQHLLDAAVFGYDHSAPLFHAAVHNAIVDILVEQRMAPHALHVRFVFEHLSEDDVLRELLVSLECWYGPREYQSLVDFVQMVDAKKKEKSFDEKELKTFHWHVHGSEEEKCQN